MKAGPMSIHASLFPAVSFVLEHLQAVWSWQLVPSKRFFSE